MPSVQQLKQRLVRTLRAKKLDAALGALDMLAQEEPEDPNWPWRAARLLRARADTPGEIAALRRALELQVDQGLVLDAIASCNAILEVAPDDAGTLETMDLLYLEGSWGGSVPAGAAESTISPDPSDSRRADLSKDTTGAPLDSLRLTECVPGARSIRMGDAASGRIKEIPIDGKLCLDDETALDLHLDEWSSCQGLKDIATAQSLCRLGDARPSVGLPGGRPERGASLRAELANIPLFGELDPASLHTLIRKVRVVSLEAGQVLFREGDPANSLYIVVDGAVVPIAEGTRRRKLAVLERGEFFGEIGLMAKQPRNATIEALVDSKLLAIGRRVVWELIDEAPSVAQGILRFLRARLIDRQMRTNLFFFAFVHAKREAVARQFRFLEVEDGATLIEAGRPPDGLFVVLSGSLAVIEQRGEANKVLDTLELGDVFGGLSLLDGRVAPADVVATGKCWLVVLGEGRFRRILEANPRLDRVLRRIAGEKTKRLDRGSVVAL